MKVLSKILTDEDNEFVLSVLYCTNKTAMKCKCTKRVLRIMLGYYFLEWITYRFHECYKNEKAVLGVQYADDVMIGLNNLLVNNFVKHSEDDSRHHCLRRGT